MAQITNTIIPCLWFDYQAKEAAAFYCSVFRDSRIITTTELVVEFELNGFPFVGLNGGPEFQFTEAISFQLLCEDQAEIDYYWNAFTTHGGEESQCSWCKDKYGLSWQVIPRRFIEMMQTGTSIQIQHITEAMLKMQKMIIADFESAFNQ